MKNKLRLKLKRLRKDNNPSVDYSHFGALNNNFFKLLETLKVSNIAGFYPIQDEINILPILLQAISYGYKLSLPRVVKKNSSLLFISWSPGDKLEKNKFGIYEPKIGKEMIVPDLVITPLLGFDREGYRLGYGGGYYDRTFGQLPDALRVALCYSFQEVEQIPSEEHDQRLDYIITEKEIIKSEIQSNRYIKRS